MLSMFELLTSLRNSFCYKQNEFSVHLFLSMAEIVEHDRQKVYIHVMTKTWQLGSVVATADKVVYAGVHFPTPFRSFPIFLLEFPTVVLIKKQNYFGFQKIHPIRFFPLPKNEGKFNCLGIQLF